MCVPGTGHHTVASASCSFRFVSLRLQLKVQNNLFFYNMGIGTFSRGT